MSINQPTIVNKTGEAPRPWDRPNRRRHVCVSAKERAQETNSGRLFNKAEGGGHEGECIERITAKRRVSLYESNPQLASAILCG